MFHWCTKNTVEKLIAEGTKKCDWKMQQNWRNVQVFTDFSSLQKQFRINPRKTYKNIEDQNPNILSIFSNHKRI